MGRLWSTVPKPEGTGDRRGCVNTAHRSWTALSAPKINHSHFNYVNWSLASAKLKFSLLSSAESPTVIAKPVARPIYSTTTGKEKEDGGSEKCEFWVCQKADIIRSVTKSSNTTAQFSASWPQRQCSVSSRHSAGSIGLSTSPLQWSEVAGPHISKHTESRDRHQHCLPTMPDMDKKLCHAFWEHRTTSGQSPQRGLAWPASLVPPMSPLQRINTSGKRSGAPSRENKTFPLHCWGKDLCSPHNPGSHSSILKDHLGTQQTALSIYPCPLRTQQSSPALTAGT